MSISGQWYLITFCAFERIPLFSDSAVAQSAVAALTERRLWRTSVLQSWVLMPDHFHALVQLHGESLSRLIGRVKSVSSATVRRENLISTPVWMVGFHDRALRSEQEISLAEVYIALNPQRAGLVAGYPYISSRFWTE